MTDKTEAQPEALRLAAEFEDYIRIDAIPSINDVKKSAAELRRLHAEIQQLKALNARLQPTIEDDSQEWAKCDPAIAFHLIERHSDNWADAGKMMTEFAEAKAEVRLKALRDELTTQTNRAAAAEQQVAALTQRLDMANRLNTDARNQLAQLSARQAAPEETIRDALVRARDWFESQAKVVSKGCGSPWNLMQLRDERDAADAALTAAPPPPEREPLTDEQIARAAVNAGMKPIYDKPKKPMVNALGSSVPFTWLKAFAHGIGATNG